MSRNPVTCELEAKVDEVMGLMSERRIAPRCRSSMARSWSESFPWVTSSRFCYNEVQSENQHLMSYIHGSM